MAMLPDDMKHVINYDEKIILILRGNETVVVSDQRLIIRKSSGLGLKKSIVDYPYSNMVNIKLDGGIRRCSVEILMRSGIQNIKISNLSKTDAYQLHRIIRENIAENSHSTQPFPVIIQSPNQARKEENGLCMKCGKRVSPDFSICPFCSSPLKMECPECGKEVDRKYKLCPYCGEDLSYAHEIDMELWPSEI